MTGIFTRRAFLAIAFAAGIVLSGRTASADAGVSASEFIAGLGERAVSALTSPDLTREERDIRFRQLPDTHSAVPADAKVVIGRVWRARTGGEKQNYDKTSVHFR